MRTLTTLALTSALALTAAPAALAESAAPGAPAAPAASAKVRACSPGDLSFTVRMLPPIASAVALVSVKNQSASRCTVNRFPTVTFGGLDGEARTVPDSADGPRVVQARQHQFAALRTDDRSAPARYAPTLTVAADPAHSGLTFTAAGIGAPTPGITVYDPVTTLWHDTQDEALAALGN
ncbi:DUF4232 domain-containing protein [Streptomyces sp. RKAG293]|uniref:DUF4232 domain-containing protein n=1 Tax=Streptomyces sp. RKAG293 TaxID=2893403 RepID=UPI00203480B0|nr:DUF4232 domain-containing protein [Streptomyces sp. RKAG293]MCM2417333.1 DUF4232 domain-containing protein [Streptomyces sp. RKAG293]